jgi:hypothetical protein
MSMGGGLSTKGCRVIEADPYLNNRLEGQWDVMPEI